MKKKLIALLAIIAGAFAFNSCSLSDEGDYVFTYELQTQLGDETNADNRHKAIQDYFKQFIDFDQSYSHFGSSSEASAYGINLYNETRKKIIDEEVQALFSMEGDAARLLMRMSGKSLNTPLIWTDWYYKGSSSQPDEKTAE